MRRYFFAKFPISANRLSRYFQLTDVFNRSCSDDNAVFSRFLVHVSSKHLFIRIIPKILVKRFLCIYKLSWYNINIKSGKNEITQFSFYPIRIFLLLDLKILISNLISKKNSQQGKTLIPLFHLDLRMFTSWKFQFCAKNTNYFFNIRRYSR